MSFDLAPYRDLYPFKSHFHARNGLNLHYVDEGAGDPVVMVHGNPTWSFYFRHLIIAFRDTHRPIALDHLGCGLSDKPDDSHYDYRLKSRIDDLESLINRLGITKKITLIVHDWGGAIGMGFATRHPEMIDRIVILNTFAFRLPAAKRFPVALWLGRNTCLGSLLIRCGNAFARAAAYVCAKKGLPRPVRQAYVAPYNSWKNRIATLRFVQDIPLVPNDPSYPDLLQIEESLPKLKEIPMLICWGLQDFVFDRHFLKEWQQKFPAAETHAFPDCGHYILEDAREQITPLIRTFFQRTPIR